MFIKKLIIADKYNIIRTIAFKQGVNLILDNTPPINKGEPNGTSETATGNNVGKTTVLKLIDFCLGGDQKNIYSDPENNKKSYDLVREFLVKNEVVITLILTTSLESADSKEIIIKRNFLSRAKSIRTINGKTVLDKDYEAELLQALLPNTYCEKPTFRQIISHNIRYKDESISQTIKTLNKYTTDVEYETLYLFLLGCKFEHGSTKQALLQKINQEEVFKARLEKKQNKNTYEIALLNLEDEINALSSKKSSFNLNENFDADLEELNTTKYEINIISSDISKNRLRKDIIKGAITEIEENKSSINLQELQELYLTTKANITNIQKSFEDLVHYHNRMIDEKVKFIEKDLPQLNEKILQNEFKLKALLAKEKKLSVTISKGESFKELEEIISQLTEKYRIKGEYENIISQLNEVEKNILEYSNEIRNIDSYLFSDDFENIVKNQVAKFNKYFSLVSNELYGETYLLTYEKSINKKNQQLYKFSSFNANMSSGKKQGEILCFDLAYTFFANKENIPCLHFLLNDKKELMHDNQLIKVSQFIIDKNVQLIVSILKDKMPQQVLHDAHIAIELSQDDKLFRIE